MAKLCIKIQDSEDFQRGILPYAQATKELLYNILEKDFSNGWPVPDKKCREMDSGDRFFYHFLTIPSGKHRDRVRMRISVVKNPSHLGKQNNFYQDYNLAFLNKFAIL